MLVESKQKNLSRTGLFTLFSFIPSLFQFNSSNRAQVFLHRKSNLRSASSYRNLPHRRLDRVCVLGYRNADRTEQWRGGKTQPRSLILARSHRPVLSGIDLQKLFSIYTTWKKWSQKYSLPLAFSPRTIKFLGMSLQLEICLLPSRPFLSSAVIWLSMLKAPSAKEWVFMYCNIQPLLHQSPLRIHFIFWSSLRGFVSLLIFLCSKKLLLKDGSLVAEPTYGDVDGTLLMTGPEGLTDIGKTVDRFF